MSNQAQKEKAPHPLKAFVALSTREKDEFLDLVIETEGGEMAGERSFNELIFDSSIKQRDREAYFEQKASLTPGERKALEEIEKGTKTLSAVHELIHAKPEARLVMIRSRQKNPNAWQKLNDGADQIGQHVQGANEELRGKIEELKRRR